MAIRCRRWRHGGAPFKGKPPLLATRGRAYGKQTGPKPQDCLYQLPILFLHTEDFVLKENDTSPQEVPKPSQKKNKQVKNSPHKWALTIFLSSFFLSVLFNGVSDTALKEVSLFPAFIILAAFILLGIIFDIFGIATATASEKPFHAMSARKVKGAKEALWLVKNAEKVSSFCNDVIGDISGIMSGSTAAVIVAGISFSSKSSGFFVPLVITGLVAAITVGGKALGKGFAMEHSHDIVFFMAKVVKLVKRNGK